MNIQTLQQTKNSLYSLVFSQNPLCYFFLLKEVKEQCINYEDELSDNWFKPSKPQNAFNQQKIKVNKIVNKEMNIDKEMDEIIDVNKEIDKMIDVDKEIDEVNEVVDIDKEVDRVVGIDKVLWKWWMWIKG
ncbi:14592_t:CDS:2 [Cetraspora pellucida]|uniref:14592_t:CDS:1 n=1 Tax=Cetraspora pellucida TaxID=1433469 RepID=A0ACA9K6V6_9GLOM|nr:14592_t:CDS:2 [Cetraspora pellucida]